MKDLEEKQLSSEQLIREALLSMLGEAKQTLKETFEV